MNFSCFLPCTEVPSRDGWVCDFGTARRNGKTCNNFRLSPEWTLFSPKLHASDADLIPDVDHTSGTVEGT